MRIGQNQFQYVRKYNRVQESFRNNSKKELTEKLGYVEINSIIILWYSLMRIDNNT